MSFIDIVILIFVILIVGSILFFNIKSWKKGENECSRCPYAKSCNKKDLNKNQENKEQCDCSQKKEEKIKESSKQ